MPRPRRSTAIPDVSVSGPRDVPSDYFDDQWVEIYPEDGLGPAYARAFLTQAELMGYDPHRAVHAVSGGFRVPADLLEATVLPDAAPPAGEVPMPTPKEALDRGAILTDADEPEALQARAAGGAADAGS